MPKLHLVTDDLLLGHTVSRALMNKLGYEVFLASELPLHPDDIEADLFIYEVPLNGNLHPRLPQLRGIAQELPLIALFKYSQHATIQLLIQAGAVDFLTLPSSLERMQTTIKNALTIFNMRRTLEEWSVDRNIPHSIGMHPQYPAAKTVELIDRNGIPKKLSLLEEEIIRQALRYHQGCLARTAKQLGIGRTTLYRKLRSYEEPQQLENQQEIGANY